MNSRTGAVDRITKLGAIMGERGLLTNNASASI